MKEGEILNTSKANRMERITKASYDGFQAIQKKSLNDCISASHLRLLRKLTQVQMEGKVVSLQIFHYLKDL